MSPLDMAGTTPSESKGAIGPRLAVFVLLCAASAAFAVWWFVSPPVTENPPGNGDTPKASAAALAAVEAALQSGRKDAAAELLAQTPVPTSLQAADAFRFSEVLREAGRLSAAERYLTVAVEQAPEEKSYRRRLADLLMMSGRYEEARRHWIRLLETGGIDLLSLPLLGNRNLSHGMHAEELKRHAEASPPDALIELGLATIALRENDFAAAEASLKNAAAENPDLLETQMKWGLLLFETGREAALEKWLREHYGGLREHPEFWILAGRLSRARGDFPSALRCFGEAFRRDPTHFVAVSQIGQLLQMRGDSGALRSEDSASRLTDPQDSGVSEWFLQHSQRVRRYADLCLSIHLGEIPSDERLRSAVEAAESISCLRDAIAWCMIAQVVRPESAWPDVELARLRTMVPPTPGRYDAALFAERGDALLALPLPEWLQSEGSPRFRTKNKGGRETTAAAAGSVAGGVWFDDIAQQAGIDFVFEDGSDPRDDETRLFEFTGGGVAVIDFDLDLHPDIYFTQGGPPPDFGRDPTDEPAVVRPSGKLYRNLGDGRFVDVTETSGTTNRVYAQGATVGDFDADGFPDLYVANIGANRLFHNNGDGTFAEVTAEPFSTHAAWTTSCVLADFNGDGLPDIYDVNHVIPRGIHARMCKKGGASVPCDVNHGLEAEQDRMLLNRGDGRFEDVTERSALVAGDGLGLGVVAADFDGSGRLSLFVANDARANFFFHNEGTQDGVPRFAELALPMGLAYSAGGKAQACMGVAVDDVNADGLLDLFVTNFYQDYNTLYRQQPVLLFDDATASADLLRVSYNYLGFGTQFLDVDSDGRRDLVLTNGDVVDFSKVESTRHYRQQPQFLWNAGNGRFEAVSPEQLGPFFERRLLGRGLARLDWNRDGREDFVVSHIGDPAALVTNTARHGNHYLDVRLIGTESSRDAIGTTVEAVTATGKQTRQLTAGDGYFASNQRNLILGLGADDTITALNVRWPSGATQTFRDVAADVTIVVLEGRPELFVLP